MAKLRSRLRLLAALAAVLFIRFIQTVRLGAKEQDLGLPEHIAQFKQKRSYSEQTMQKDSWDIRNKPYDDIGKDADYQPDYDRDEGECYDPIINWNKKIEPKYMMNPNKFLIPSLTNGPNNQMMGFQQSILLALILNRTLVLPNFFEHQLQWVHFRRMVPPKYRLDISKVRQFISVVPNDEAVRLCNSRLDGIFSSKGRTRVVNSLSRLVQIYMETGFSGFEFAKGVRDKEIDALKRYLYENEDINDEQLTYQQWWPKRRKDFFWTWKIMKSSDPVIPIFPASSEDQSIKLENVRNVFNTDGKCILYWSPFRDIQFKKEFGGKPKIHGKFDIEHLSSANGWDLYADILLHSMPPRSVMEWAKEFRQEVFGQEQTEYIAVHWRFDEEDFFEYLCKKEGGREKFCAEVRRATNVTAIATGIVKRISEIISDYHKTIRVVYFAAPPSLKSLTEGVKRQLNNLKHFRIITKSLGIDMKILQPTFFSADDIQRFLLQRHSNCAMTSERQLQDTISQVEMDVCENSFSFMWSRQSTWSITVRLHRYLRLGSQHRRMDVSSLDYALKSTNTKK